ncbi:MAG TPA: dihydrofolate reductase family protein [Longilinea sp.]|nr:dihydrofolate reductase family protein [Longilinea sp.]
MTITCSVFIATSLDGFIARKDGAIDWLSRPEDAIAGEDYGYQAFFDSVDTLVMGRNTFELALSFEAWPYAGKRVVVLSSGSPKIPPSLARHVEHMSGAPAEIVRWLAERGAQHVYVDGGDTIRRFLRAGLIDDLTITRLPILLGDGIPLFGPLEGDIRLQQVETTVYPNGFVQSKYQVKNDHTGL